MTGEIPQRAIDDDYEVSILSYSINEEAHNGVEEVQYVATAEGPDGYVAGFTDTLDPEDYVETAPDVGEAYIGVGHVSVPVDYTEGTDDVWPNGVALLSSHLDDLKNGILEVRQERTGDQWWTVPAYIETDP